MSYDMIDRFLRNNLGDDDYAEYSAALDALCTPQPKEPEQEPVAFCKVEDVYDNDSLLTQLGVKRGDLLYTTPPQRKPQQSEFEEYCKTLHPLWNSRISRTEAEGFFHAGWLAAHGIKE
jgi:hypothetical protein